MKKIPIPTILTAAALVLVLVLYSITYQVKFFETAFIERLGKADESSVATTAGIKFRFPPPIDRVKTYDTRLKVLDTPEVESTTRDGQNIVIGCYALWRIANPLTFYRRVPDGVEAAEEKLRARINLVRDTVIGTVDMSAFVNLDASKVRYTEIERAMVDQCRAEILDDFGVHIEAIGIRRISLPERATEKVFDNMSARRATIAATSIEEGNAAAAAIEARAQANADKILAFASRRAEEIKSEGVRATTRIFEQIGPEDAELFHFMKSIDALEAIFQQGTTFFLDTRTELFRVFSDRPGAIETKSREQQ